MNKRNQWLKEFSQNSDLWASELDNIPSMIVYTYKQLKRLAQEGQVYGTLLQCKDVYESLYKIPIIAVLIVLNSNSEYKDISGYSDIIKTALETPMSMGNWDLLARIIVKNSKSLCMPIPLVEILKRTNKLYNTEITADASDVVNWRNNEIGHGALRFEDDEDYQEEIKKLLSMLKVYFDGNGKKSIKGLYDSIFLSIGNKKLIGSQNITDADEDILWLNIEEKCYDPAYFINGRGLSCYLFDSFYSKRGLVKYYSYIDCQNDLLRIRYFSNLFEMYVRKRTKDYTLNSDFISRQDDLILECLNMPSEYIRPAELIDELMSAMEDLEHGIITIFMERGTGKSAFSNHMSGLYHKSPLIKNSFSRCYHVQNASFRGINDFVNSINFSFRHSCDAARDLWGSTAELPFLTGNTVKPAEDMAHFLNFYHQKYRKEYTLLIIDGIDEITEQTKSILRFIPSRDQLEEGVFIVLLSRFKDEDTVIGSSIKSIELAEKKSQRKIEVRRTDEANINVLESYLNTQKEIIENKYEIIKKADYRFLYLKAYLAINDLSVLNTNNELLFVRSYMDYLLSYYSLGQSRKAKEIAVTIALFPSMTITGFQEYMNCPDITYEFVGIINDLLPVLTVNHINGEACYEFADSSYTVFVLTDYIDVVETVVRFFEKSLMDHLGEYISNSGLARINASGNTEEEEQLNQDIVFFAEGLLSTWSKTTLNQRISDIFYTNTLLIQLAFAMVSDHWTSSGYGNVLERELIDCITECIYWGLKDQRGEEYKSWIKQVNGFLSDHKYRFEVHALYEGSKFGCIYDFLLAEYKSIRNYEEWFWVFESGISDEFLAVISKLNILDQYVDHMMKSSVSGDEWIDSILARSISPQLEQRLLNYKLDQYFEGEKYPHTENYNAKVKECIDTILKKGYEIEGKYIAHLDSIEQGELKAIHRKRRIESAIKELVDFSHSIEYKTNGFSATYYAYLDLDYDTGKIEDTLRQDINELHHAYYKRLCYERDSDNLAGFIEREIPLKNNLQDILKCVFPEKEDWYIELLKWIEQIKPLSEAGNDRINTLLANAMVISARHCIETGKTENALMAVEEMVYEADTKGFFSAHFLNNYSQAQQPMCIYEKTKMIYCTDNVLFALDLFKKEGDQKRFSELLNTVETSIPIINKNHIPDKAMQVMCEIQEYKFIKMRKRWKIRNQFDQYLEAIAEDHIKSISAFISEMTRYSDYRVLAAEIELVMEYIWQTEQWEAGDKICSDLIELLRSADIYSDDIVKKSIENEIRKIEKCSLLFDLIKGKKTLKFEDASYIISSFDLPPEYKTIYRAAGALQDSGDERVIRELVLDANRLELETY